MYSKTCSLTVINKNNRSAIAERPRCRVR